MTDEEKSLLERFHNGEFNGMVGDPFRTNGGSDVWTEINNNKITRYKQGPGGRFFDGKENESYNGVLHVLVEWITDEEVLEFFRKFGWLMADTLVNRYSAKFKPKK